jgi:hypothetical protein
MIKHIDKNYVLDYQVVIKIVKNIFCSNDLTIYICIIII